MNKRTKVISLFLIVSACIGFAAVQKWQSTVSPRKTTGDTQLPAFNESAPRPVTSASNRLIIGTLTIPSAEISELPITIGTDEATLSTGMAGAYAWGSPGDEGVFAMAGHRVGAGGPFRQLNLVRAGDHITVLSEGKSFTYRVISNQIVNPKDTSVLSGPSNESRIVLITCTPLNTYTKRIVVTGKLIDIK